MSPFFDDLEDQLQAAARARAERGEVSGDPPHRRSRWAWLRAGARTAPLVAAVATTLAVVVGALVLLGHGRGPAASAPAPAAKPAGGELGAFASLPPKRLRTELGYISAATKRAISSPACRGPVQIGSPPVHQAPGHALLSILGVLRRPATGVDAIGTDFGQTDTQLYAGYTRRALVAGGVSYYIAAGRNVAGFGIPSARCFALQAAALQNDLPHIPASLRAQTARLQAQLISYDSRLSHAPPMDTICLVSIGRNGTGSLCGEPAAAIAHGQVPSDDNGTDSGVVPDGVASVTLHFPPARGRPARAVTTTVTNNVFAVPVGGAGPPAAEPTVTWRSARGRVIKTVSLPSPRAIKLYCGRQAAACLSVQGGFQTSSASSGTMTTPRARPAPKGG